MGDFHGKVEDVLRNGEKGIIGVFQGAIYHFGYSQYTVCHSFLFDAAVFQFSDLYRTRKADADAERLFFSSRCARAPTGASTLPIRIERSTRLLSIAWQCFCTGKYSRGYAR